MCGGEQSQQRSPNLHFIQGPFRIRRFVKDCNCNLTSQCVSDVNMVDSYNDKTLMGRVE